MATRKWIGNAPKIAQVNTITPANVNIGNTFTVTINGKAITVTATAATVANVTGLLAAALQACDYPEFQEITWADATTYVSATSKVAGRPFTQTSSASGGTATNTTATATANSSPNDVNTAANWSSATLPTGGDTVIIEDSDVDLLYSLSSLSAVTLAVLRIERSFTGKIGLPEMNREGATAYPEYRTTYWAISATLADVGIGQEGAGSGRIKLNFGSVQATLNVHYSASPADDGLYAVQWKGTHASNAVNVLDGSIDVAPFSGETAVIATLRQGGGQVRCTSGVTLTTINKYGGDLITESAITTLTHLGGETIHLDGALTTLALRGGTVDYRSDDALATATVSGTQENPALLTFDNDPRAKAVTNPIDLYGSFAQVSDVNKVVATLIVDCNEGADPSQVEFGSNVRLTRGAVA